MWCLTFKKELNDEESEVLHITVTFNDHIQKLSCVPFVQGERESNEEEYKDEGKKCYKTSVIQQVSMADSYI